MHAPAEKEHILNDVRSSIPQLMDMTAFAFGVSFPVLLVQPGEAATAIVAPPALASVGEPSAETVERLSLSWRLLICRLIPLGEALPILSDEAAMPSVFPAVASGLDYRDGLVVGQCPDAARNHRPPIVAEQGTLVVPSRPECGNGYGKRRIVRYLDQQMGRKSGMRAYVANLGESPIFSAAMRYTRGTVDDHIVAGGGYETAVFPLHRNGLRP